MSDEDVPSVGEFVEYCRTQSRLLAGRAERMRSEVADLLEEIDDETTRLRARLEERADVEGTATPPSTDGPDADGIDVTALEDLERKQTVAAATGDRLSAVEDLSAEYGALARTLSSEIDDGRTAMERVVRFEAHHDAPTYFENRRTVYEAAVASSDADRTDSDGE